MVIAGTPWSPRRCSGAGGPLYGATSLVMFVLGAAHLALGAVVDRAELSYIEAGRTLTYLVIFAAATAARWRPAPRSPCSAGS